jgi:hypothetical protein
MSIKVLDGITVVSPEDTDSACTIVIEPRMRKAFNEMVQRGTNLWPDAHPVIKELADIITVGVIQQNYQEQNVDQRNKPKVD